MKVLCFGNELVEEDRLALEVGRKLARELKEHEFIECRMPDEMLEFEGEELICLDAAEGVGEVRFVEFEELARTKMYSLHDFDLGFFLKLTNPKNVRVIGIPKGMNVEKAAEAVKQLLSSLKAQ